MTNALAGERKNTMKTIQEAEALKRELINRIEVLNVDGQFISLQSSAAYLTTLRARLQVVDQIIQNFLVYDWFYNANTGTKRTDIVEVK